jgi:RNA polymerase sigma-70 factor (ECF subfamily)
LEEQDRSRWDRGAISEGLTLVEKALSSGPVGTYQLQAAIAALLAQSIASAETDWPQIAALYEELMKTNPSPVIALNRATAVAMSGRIEDGLDCIEELGRTGVLDQYYLFHAARADLLRRLNQNRDAEAAYQKAAALSQPSIASISGVLVDVSLILAAIHRVADLVLVASSQANSRIQRSRPIVSDLMKRANL